jgi:hypothetical protein
MPGAVIANPADTTAYQPPRAAAFGTAETKALPSANPTKIELNTMKQSVERR